MAIVWTKLWSGSDDGTILRGIDLRNIQDDLAGVLQTSDIGVLVQGYDDDLQELSTPGFVNTYNIVKNGAFDIFTATPTPDSWVVEGGGVEAQETSLVRIGGNSYSITSDADGSASRQTIYMTISSTENTHWRGRYFTLSALVYTGVASNARISLDDGVTVSNSAYHSGTPGWELLTITKQLSSVATKLDVILKVDGNVQEAKFDGVRLHNGKIAWEFTPQTAPSVLADILAVTGGGAVVQVGVFTTGGTWTAPTGVTHIMVTLCGAGGGGGGGRVNSPHNSGTGGGGGTVIKSHVMRVTPGNSYAVVVGAGGAGGLAGVVPTDGAAGGLSSIVGNDHTAIAFGGGAGQAGENPDADVSGAGGAGVIDDNLITNIKNLLNGSGPNGATRFATPYTPLTYPGGDGGDCAVDSGRDGGAGGSSLFGQGGDGGEWAGATNGTAGRGVGAGGGGGSGARDGGAGIAGIVIIQYNVSGAPV